MLSMTAYKIRSNTPYKQLFDPSKEFLRIMYYLETSSC